MKQSRRASRMAKHHKRFGKGSLHLVSLMDIFTILVFFLLVNSSDVTQLPSSKDVRLPDSKAIQLPEQTLVVMVNQNDIIIQGRKVADARQVMAEEQDIIEPLLAELNFQAGQRWQSDGEVGEQGGEATIMGDKQIPYKLLRKIMMTLSEGRYTDIKLAVVKESKAAG